MAVFTEEFLDSLPGDPEEAVQKVCSLFIERMEGPPSERPQYQDCIEAYACLEALIEASGLPISIPAELGDDEGKHIPAIYSAVRMTEAVLNRRRLSRLLPAAREKFRTRLGMAFLYEFSEGDLTRIQCLLNELREMIASSEVFNAKHKERILKKLEGLQGELHKTMSSLDKLWGLVGEAGVVLGKFGKDAKPFVDRIREIAQIVWRTQARAEELPSASAFPLLSPQATSEADKTDD